MFSKHFFAFARSRCKRLESPRFVISPRAARSVCGLRAAPTVDAHSRALGRSGSAWSCSSTSTATTASPVSGELKSAPWWFPRVNSSQARRVLDDSAQARQSKASGDVTRRTKTQNDDRRTRRHLRCVQGNVEEDCCMRQPHSRRSSFAP